MIPGPSKKGPFRRGLVSMQGRRLFRLLVGGLALICPLALTPATTALAAPPGTHTQADESAACAALYSVPVTSDLGACQWDMRAIGATATGSYAINRGQGARVGDIDTGIDLTHTD